MFFKNSENHFMECFCCWYRFIYVL